MIAGILHEGSGLGNQLHRYVATRVLAADKGLEFGMHNPELFKGADFMDLDMGTPISPQNAPGKEFYEKRVDHPNGTDIRPYDPLWADVEDGTTIDGEFQDPKYFMHRLDEVRSWLAVDPMRIDANICVIGFRGGEYQYFPDLFLTQKYWDDAMNHVLARYPDTQFHVVTDDPELARRFFDPRIPITHEMGEDWRMIRHAKMLILANSSFFILPAMLNQRADLIVAPKYWARHNVSDGYWALEQNRYPGWTYLDRDGQADQD